MKQGKIWGRTQKIFGSSAAEVHLLEVERGGFSSEHLHQSKRNTFVLISGGPVEILQWDLMAGKGKADVTTLSALGDMTFVPAGLWHQFRARAKAILIEIYDVALSDDIERRSRGGGGGKR